MIRRAGAVLVSSVVVAVVLLVIGLAASQYAAVAVVGALVVLVVGLTVYEPVALPVLAMPALTVVDRVGGESFNLTVSDVALFAATWAAVFLAPRPFSRAMRSMLWLCAVYQVATLFTVLVHPYRQNTVEWVHAGFLIAGALLVGWAVGAAGRARVGLTLFMVPCLVIAGLACAAALQQLAAGALTPVYLDWPWGMHKNLIGPLLASAALLAYARPEWVGWPKWFAVTSFWLCTLGALAAQSRQALVGLGVGLLVVALRPDPDRRRSRLVFLAVIPVMAFVASRVRDDFTGTNEFNSSFVRLTWYEQALDVWRIDPVFGVGLRWWVAGRTEYEFQPPNVELEVLSSVGLLGLTAFLVMIVGGIVVAWRVPARFGTLAVAVLLARFVQSQFDQFWVSVLVSVPYLVVGVCLGAEQYARSREEARRGRGADGTDELRSVVEMLEAERRNVVAGRTRALSGFTA